MSGVYKVGFPDGTSVAEAKEQALAIIRGPVDEGGADDQDEVTAGPDVVQSEAHEDAGQYLVRIVTGVPDPAVARRAQLDAEARTSATDTVVARLLELPASKLAALSALLDKL